MKRMVIFICIGKWIMELQTIYKPVSTHSCWEIFLNIYNIFSVWDKIASNYLILSFTLISTSFKPVKYQYKHIGNRTMIQINWTLMFGMHKNYGYLLHGKILISRKLEVRERFIMSNFRSDNHTTGEKDNE